MQFQWAFQPSGPPAAVLTLSDLQALQADIQPRASQSRRAHESEVNPGRWLWS